MQKLLFFCFLTLFLSACGGPTQSATETKASEMEAASPTDPKDISGSAIFTPAELVGLYHGHVSNIQAYAVIITESNGQLQFTQCQNSEVAAVDELTMEMIKERPEDFPFTPFTNFELSEDGTKFTSDWGKGWFQRGQFGLELVIEEMPGSGEPTIGTKDEKVSLYKMTE